MEDPKAWDEKERKRHKKYYDELPENKKQKMIERKKSWNKKNRNKVLAYKKKYYQKHKEQIKKMKILAYRKKKKN